MSGAEENYTAIDLVKYFGVLLTSYLFFMYIPSTWAEMMTAQASAFLFNLFGFASSYGLSGELVYLTLDGGPRDVYVFIIRECTAIHVWGILLGLIMPLKYGDLRRKILGVLFSAGLITVMNITRIMLTLYLTGYNVPPFSWFFTNPTVETYHYPISFVYGVIGIAITTLLVTTYILPELGDFLAYLPTYIQKSIMRTE
jgi:exosortase/archaeosortase family protein